MRTSLEEASALLGDYRNKLEKLEGKANPIVQAEQKLVCLEIDLKKTQSAVACFNGLRRDLQYIQLCNRLSDLFLRVINISNKSELETRKNVLLAGVNKCIKEMELKVTRNETVLIDILNEQVECIGRGI
ncbi:hypothetical protein JTB14_032160 [Gonioctena quinquepunctata]|nr:hypothetical protein JTB14_032160 [Gonioctena quinquepunctata]